MRSDLRRWIVYSAFYRSRRIAARFGISLGKLEAAASWEYSLALLDKCGLRPRTVFDVGVAQGTPWLYAAFPEARFVLVDPAEESLPHMNAIAKRFNAEVHNVALGRASGTENIIVRADDISASTFYEEVGEAKVSRRYPVPIRTFADLASNIERPCLVKIDVQGSELSVLEGMAGSLDKVDVIIVETSTIATIHGAPETPKIIDFFARHRWSMADVLALTRRPLDGALAQLDIMFVPEASPLRADKRWAA